METTWNGREAGGPHREALPEGGPQGGAAAGRPIPVLGMSSVSATMRTLDPPGEACSYRYRY